MEKNSKKSEVKWVPLVITILAGVLIWFSPIPSGVTPQAWHLFAIFVATITGIILKVKPMGAVAIIGIAVTALTGVLDPANPGNAVA